MTPAPRSAAQARPALQNRGGRLVIGLAFFVMLLLGGAGSDFPLIGAAVQSCALAIVALGLVWPDRLGLRARLSLPLLTLILALGLLIASQLVPLPPALWTALPGRELPAQLLRAASLRPGWHALSLDPSRTATTLLELLPACAAAVLAGKADRTTRITLLELVILTALLSAMAGALQRLGQLDWLLPAGAASGQDSAGIFRNRDHHATFLAVAIPLSALWAATSARFPAQNNAVRLVVGWGLVLILAAATAATSSRAGIGLLCMAIPAAAVLLRDRVPQLRTVLVVVAPLIAIISVASFSPTVRYTLSRFSDLQDLRPLFWRNTLTAAHHYAPFGSGIGTFDSIYPTVEPRNQLISAFVYNAHNDYLELWLEGGVPLLAVAALVLMVAGRTLAQRSVRQTSASHQKILFAAVVGLVLIAGHSLVDYPARMMTNMALVGLLLGTLLGHTSPGTSSDAGSASAAATRSQLGVLAQRGAVAVIGLLLLGIVWSSALAERAMLDKNPKQALGYNPWSSDALATAGYQALYANDPHGALALAERAMQIAPMNARAVALTIESLITQQQLQRANALLPLATKLGWREPHIQYLLLDRANDRADDQAVVDHADALLRTNNYADLVLPFLRRLEAVPSATPALTRVLAEQPTWRKPFLEDLASLTPEQSAAHLTLLLSLNRSIAPTTAAESNALIAVLLNKGQTRAALDAAAQFGLESAGPRLLTKTSLAGLVDPAAGTGPFAWRSEGAVGVAVEARADGALLITASRATAGRVISRLVAMPPGPFVLRGQGQIASADQWDWFGWSMRCQGTDRLVVPITRSTSPRGGQGFAFEVRFVIPPEGCPIQHLDFNLDSSAGSSTELTFEGLWKG